MNGGKLTELELLKSEWIFARGLTLELLDPLTDLELSQVPGGNLGPVWKQFRHVGRLQECYVEALNTKTISFDHDKQALQCPDGYRTDIRAGASLLEKGERLFERCPENISTRTRPRIAEGYRASGLEDDYQLGG